MSGNLLEPHEKVRFSQWLEMQIYSSSAMVEQFKKMRVPDALINKEELEIAACKMVLHMINSGEDVTVGQ